MKRRLPWDSYFALDRRHRLDHVFEQFETEEATWLEDHHRSLAMRNTVAGLIDRPEHNVAGYNVEDLVDLDARLAAAVRTGVHSASLGSSAAMRNLRLSLIGAALAMFEAYSNEELIVFTVLNEGWVLTPEQLAQTSASDIRDKFRRHLVRAGVDKVDGPLVGFIHGEYEPLAGVYVLHFHGITMKTKKSALNLLSGRWGYVRTSSGANPIKCDTIRDRVEQLSYCLKSYWLQRAVRIIGGRTERDREGRRIDEPHHTFALTWLDRHSPSQITLLMGCRVGRGGQLVEHDGRT